MCSPRTSDQSFVLTSPHHSEEAAAAQEKQRRDAEQEAAIRREEWQGYDTYEEFMAAKQAHEKDIQDRDKHYADVKPFDLLEQHRIFGELHNDYKLRIAHHNEWLKWQPMSSHFSEDYKKRWCESSTDEPEPELREGDLIYDEPIWAVRPGQWGALCACA